MPPHPLFTVDILPCRKDNYAFLLRHIPSSSVYIIDTPDGDKIADYCQKNQYSILGILNTHHHQDHIGGNLLLKSLFNCPIYGNQEDQKRIAGITDYLSPHDTLILFEDIHPLPFYIMPFYGHTIGHIGYYSHDLDSLFVGDTLFNLGCGRLFEGTAKQMWQSMLSIRQLPLHTLLYAAHEYSLENAKFVAHYFPQMDGLNHYIQKLQETRSKGGFTIPMDLNSQIKWNPFLQCDMMYIQQVTCTISKAAETTFAQLRYLKDIF